MGDSQVMTRTRGAEDEELMVSEVELETLPRASEPTTEPAEGGGSDGESGGEEEEQIKWQGGPNQPPGTGTGGGTGGSGTSGS